MIRRQFIRLLALFGILGGFVGTSAISCNSILTQLDTWIPTGLAAFDGIVAIINPAAGSILAIATTTASNLWSALSAAIANYQHTTDPTGTLLEKVIAALDALQGGLADVLAALPAGIPAGVMIAVKAGFALILATLKSIESHLQPPMPVPAPASLSAKLSAVGPLPAPAKSQGDFVNKFNAIMAANNQPLRVK